MKKHKLKIKQEFAQLYYENKKYWEIRLNDRNFKVNDLIEFTIIETGSVYVRTIVYIFDSPEYGLKEGYVILSIV